MFIKLHYHGKSRYFNVNNISAVCEDSDGTTLVYLSGDKSPFCVDELVESIANRLPIYD